MWEQLSREVVAERSSQLYTHTVKLLVGAKISEDLTEARECVDTFPAHSHGLSAWLAVG